jgi:hypothetical protein
VTFGDGGKQLELHRLRAAVSGERVKVQALTPIANGGFLQERE